MLPDEWDSGWLWDMREAILDALEIARGRTLDELRAGVESRRALRDSFTQLGEAASKISSAFRQAHPEIPWRDIVSMRNRIVHDYRNVNWRVVWDVIQNELEPLLAQINQMLPPELPGTKGTSA